MSFNPYDLLLSKINTEVSQLEAYKTLIKDPVDSFRTDLFDYSWKDVTPLNTVESAVNDITPESLGADTSDMEAFDNFVGDCLNQILGKVKNEINKVLDVVADTIDDIAAVAALPEKELMKALQQVEALVDKYSLANLIAALDINIQCITDADALNQYTAQVQDLNNRIDAVVSDLYLDVNGNFSFSTLTSGASAALTDNLSTYRNQVTTTVSTTVDRVNSTVDSYSTTNVNPQRYF